MQNEFAKCEIKTSEFSGRKPRAGNYCPSTAFTFRQFQGHVTRFRGTVFAGPSRIRCSSAARADLPLACHFLICYSFTFLAARAVILGEIKMVITLPPDRDGLRRLPAA